MQYYRRYLKKYSKIISSANSSTCTKKIKDSANSSTCTEKN